VSRQKVNELLRERRAVTPEMALRLSRLFAGRLPFRHMVATPAGDIYIACSGVNKLGIVRLAQ